MCCTCCPIPQPRCREARLQDELAARVSQDTRALLQQYGSQPSQLPHLTAVQLMHHEQQRHLVTRQGAVATLRLAQPLLAGFCAKLPGSDR